MKRIAQARPAPTPSRLLLAAAFLFVLIAPASRDARALCGDVTGADLEPAVALPGGDRRLVLTFDAAWSDDGANDILDTLKSRGVHATFFLAGRFVVEHPEIARRIASEGHEAANHTFSHDHMTSAGDDGRMRTRSGLTAAALRTEMLETAEVYQAATGLPIAPLWRAPYGETNSEILSWGREAGYTHVAWSYGLDAVDWVSDPASRLFRTPGAALRRLLINLGSRTGREGPAVILMHLGSTRPAGMRFGEALPGLIDTAVRLGYRFETAGEALREGPLP